MSVEEVFVRPPPKSDDIPLRIYSNPICPYAQRTRLVAAFKGVNHEIIEVHLKKKPKWFLNEINPYGLVPVIEHDHHIIRESAVTFGKSSSVPDYIDEVFGGSDKLWPSDTYQRAQTRLLLGDFASQFTPNFYKYYFNKADDTTAPIVLKYLKSLEAVISEYGGPFIFGKKVTAVDLMIWPWFERLRVFADVIPGFSDFYSIDKVPLIFKWVESMLSVETVKKLALSAESHKHFLESVKKSGGATHDYSMADVSGKGLKIYCTELD